MAIRSIRLRAVLAILAVGTALTACGSSETGSAENTVGTTNDINPHDVSEIRDGGNLRLVLAGFPETFNALHIDSTGDVSDVVAATLPSSIRADAAGEVTTDPDYFTNIELTSTDPQTITYTINPKAVWSDGSPITWEDLKYQWAALNGADPGYLVSSQVGFDRVSKVERGVDDRQAIVTFGKPYAEWKQQYGVIYPKSVTQTPDAFNNSLRDTLPVSAGPFKIASVDRAQNRVTLDRNPLWWGDQPKLDSITFTVLAREAWVPAIQNNEVDSIDFTTIQELTALQSTPSVAIRRTPLARFSHITFNGAPGSILEDPALRRAVAKAIDRNAIAKVTQQGIVADPQPLNNHIYVAGQTGYQDNSGVVAFDREQAASELDALGWKLNGDIREKDGKQLVLRDVMYQQDSWVQIAQVIQDNLKAVGIKLEIDTYPGNGLFTDIIDPGNYDICQFTWSGSVFPLSALDQIYAYHPENLMGNKARIGTPELNELIERTLSELDPDKAIELANEADEQIFELVHNLPIVQSAGLTAQPANLANWGSFGLASPDFTKVGFLK